MNLCGAAAAYGVAHACRFGPSDSVVLVLGATTRQFAVASFVALSLLHDARLLAPAIPYCLLMWVTAGAAALLARAPRSALPCPRRINLHSQSR